MSTAMTPNQREIIAAQGVGGQAEYLHSTNHALNVNATITPSGEQDVNLIEVGGSAIALGQTTMAASLPVTIASNQTAFPVSQSGTWNIGTVATITNPVTVTATNLDIRDLSASTDSVTIHGDVGVADQFDLTNSNPLVTALVDANGDQITSFGGGTQYANGDTVVTPTGTLALGYDGTDVLALATDASGNLQVDVLASALPSGASTLAEQQTQTTALGTIDTTLTDNSQLTQIVDAGGEAVTVTGGKLDVNATISGSGGGTASIDDSAFSAGVDSGTPMMGFATSDAVDSGDVGVLAMDVNRNLKVIAQSNSGVDIGDVTINNGAGASAVNIQDGGNTITVDGTVAATQSGAWTVTANAGTNLNTSALLTTTDFNNSFGTAGSADSQVRTIQGVASMTPVQVSQATASNLNATVIGAGSAGTANTGVVTVQGIAAMTPLLVTPSANSAINLAQVNGQTVNVGTGAAGTGTQRVTTSTDSTIGTVTTVTAVTAITNALPAGTNGIGKLTANSGVDIGDVDVTSAVTGTIDHGSNQDIDTSAEQITATSFACKFGLTLRAPITNTSILWIGNSDVTVGGTAATDGMPLYPGDSLFLPVTNSNIPYAIASANNQVIYWIGA